MTPSGEMPLLSRPFSSNCMVGLKVTLVVTFGVWGNICGIDVMWKKCRLKKDLSFRA